MAPGAVDLGGGLCPPAAGGLQLLHHGLDLLGFGAVRNTASSVQPPRGFQLAPHQQPAAQAAVAAASLITWPCSTSSWESFCPEVSQVPPTAHVAPARIQGQHTAQFRFLHHGNVNGHVGAFGVPPVPADGIQVGRVR